MEQEEGAKYGEITAPARQAVAAPVHPRYGHDAVRHAATDAGTQQVCGAHQAQHDREDTSEENVAAHSAESHSRQVRVFSLDFV